MGACRRKTHLEHVVGAHPRVQGDPAPTEAVGVDQRMNVAIELRMRQHLDDEIALPGTVALGFPVLDRAAAAGSKVWAKRRDPFRAGMLDRDQTPSIGMMARYRRHLHGLAAKRIRHIDVLAAFEGDAVAEMADMIDDEVLSHGAHRGRIRYCRRRR